MAIDELGLRTQIYQELRAALFGLDVTMHANYSVVTVTYGAPFDQLLPEPQAIEHRRRFWTPRGRAGLSEEGCSY